jgi:hypothetical protein
VIVASLVLIIGAVVLLVLGLIGGYSGMLAGSIGTSLLAAVALVVGVRQAGAARAAAGLDDEDEQYDDVVEQEWAPRSEQRLHREQVPIESRSTGRAAVMPLHAEHGWAAETAVSAPAEPPGAGVPSQVIHDGYNDGYGDGHNDGHNDGYSDRYDAEYDADYDNEDPADEPFAQRVAASVAARVARLSAEVLVIDGRPRYHVPGCVHLLGRPFEPLPVSEAVELGFTPCGLCEPDSALLADARRV